MIGRTIFVAGAFALTGCGGDSGSGSNLPASFKSGIDQLKREGDCVALQSRFDGVSDADYLRYIDNALRAAGCYD